MNLNFNLNFVNLVTKYTAHIVLALLTWAILWAILGESAEPPSGTIFAFVVLYAASHVASLASMVVRVPKILGMLAAGFILSNTTWLVFDEQLSSLLRNIALATILLRAGLELDYNVIQKLSGVCLRVTFIPIITETVLIGILGHYLLDMPFIWSFMTGFALSGMCAAITVPFMTSLQQQGYGTDKGVPTIIIAAGSVDDVLSITGFFVMLGFVFDVSDDTVGQQVSFLIRRSQ